MGDGFSLVDRRLVLGGRMFVLGGHILVLEVADRTLALEADRTLAVAVARTLVLEVARTPALVVAHKTALVGHNFVLAVHSFASVVRTALLGQPVVGVPHSQ